MRIVTRTGVLAVVSAAALLWGFGGLAAQAQGALNPKLPSIAVLYTLYARACDPVLEFLKIGELYSNEEIIALVLSTCFEGLETR